MKKYFLALLYSWLVGIVCAVIGGAIIANPIQIANNLSPAFYIGGLLAGKFRGTTFEEKVICGIAGVGGGIAGWFCYRLLVLGF